ncbi:hypothetical protein BGAL_0056g00340 [Botrytis galanthina]|uniref:Uncharacterized protein n=1 Tax=Botrytis galanthina TaxID=278940 RepID=A0A4V4HVH2_9HELO|nr:hypothetical protein BGAL_0056g00340 [Botrytis galanthina]
MSVIRLLRREPNGEIVFHEPTSGNVPVYAILSHTWGAEEVIYQDLKKSKNKSKTVNKAGWKKIQFCAKQAAADGLEYFWIDTCCIDKKNAVELGAAINSMFRWYQNAARCYVYLSDVSKPESGVDDQSAWEAAFRKSRWFTRGWTLQELIAPKLVEFFSSEGRRLGTKLSLESEIHEITGIAKKALQSHVLSNFSIEERRSWAEHRKTTMEEDEAYCLIGIFDVSMVPNYVIKATKLTSTGVDFEQFAVGLNLASFPEATQFVAREKELSEMYELLQDHSSRSCVTLHGLGGMGKTQLAVTYAKRHKEKYTAIFWLNANDKDSLKLSFRGIAQQIMKQHPSTTILPSVDQDEDLDQAISAVKDWLDSPQNTKWLMIYDNLDNPKTSNNLDKLAVDIRQFFPRADHGSIIITTRSSQVRQGTRIHVQKLLDIREGLEIVSNTSGREGIEKGRGDNNKVDPDAIALVKELDGLPLALSTAGVYLEHVTTSFSDYLQLYKTSWLQLQKTSPLLDSYIDRTLYTTWQITFDRIQQQNPASASLLKLWGYFHREDLWFDLLRHANFVDDEWIRKLTEDELNFNEAVTLLCTFGLVNPDKSPQQQTGARVYSVHSCVHSWIVFVLNKEWDKSLARLVLTCIASEVPNKNEKYWWLLQRRLLQHATQQDSLIEDTKIDIDGLYWEFHKFGNLYFDQGKLVEAEVMYLQALEGKEKALGLNHTSTLDTVHKLGNLYRNQDKRVEAGVMYLRALEGKEKALGLNHTSTLDTVHKLGNLYRNQGKRVEAEKMYLRALEGKEKALGLNHTSTLDTVHKLGNLYSSQGKLAKAEKMYLRALEGYENALGPVLVLSYLPALNTMFVFGDLFSQTNRKDKAREMYNRALSGYAIVQGPSSKRSRHIEERLQALKVVSDESNIIENEFTVPEVASSRSLKQKIRQLGRRLNIR